WDIGDEAMHHLLDRELPEEEQTQILAIANAPAEILEVHDLRTRQSGRTKFVQMHLVMQGSTPLSKAHQIGEQIEAEIEDAFHDVDVLVHLDPHTEAVNELP
ncbi:cation diffusion facilitator family transporter, partial [Oleiphilus sp. HI0079]